MDIAIMIHKTFKRLENDRLILLLLFALGGCSVADHAMMYPEASYVNGEEVKHIDKHQSVTIIGSDYDEYGNVFAAYPSIKGNSHKKIYMTPPPKMVFVQCFRQYYTSAGQSGYYHHTVHGNGFATIKNGFQTNKTYQVYCNRNLSTYIVGVKEVHKNAKFNNSRTVKTEKPTDNNRINFVSTGKKLSLINLYLASSGMGIRNWDGKILYHAELAAPVDRVFVRCRINRKALMVDIKHHFEAGKTYRLACRLTKNNKMEAFVAEKL